jgi:ABC-type transport system involved in cytochrome c biogenesis permease component
MKSVWKLLCLLGCIVLVMITAFAYAVLFQLSSQEVLLPVLSAGVLLLVGRAVFGGIDAVFTKRHTAATGFG